MQKITEKPNFSKIRTTKIQAKFDKISVTCIKKKISLMSTLFLNHLFEDFPHIFRNLRKIFTNTRLNLLANVINFIDIIRLFVG